MDDGGCRETRDADRRRAEALARREELWRKRLRLERKLEYMKGEPGDNYLWHERLRMFLVACLIWMTGLYARGRRNRLDFKKTEITLRFEALPECLRGFTILFLSDLHFNCAGRRFPEAAASFLNGIEVDLCLLGGDYRLGHLGREFFAVENILRLLEGVRRRYGTYLVLGNHDNSDVCSGWPENGPRVLVNEGMAVGPGDAIWVAGVDDPHRFGCDCLDAALLGCSGDAFRILLVHSPEIVDEAATKGIQLYLCGHTHGGQVCLPGGIPVKYNARCPRAYASGLWRRRGMTGYTSRGLGAADLPLRYHCPPEAVVITLERA